MMSALRAQSEYGCWRSTSSNFLAAGFRDLLVLQKVKALVVELVGGIVGELKVLGGTGGERREQQHERA
jgi:hypothetical protein